MFHSSRQWRWLLDTEVIILFLHSFGPQVEMVYSLLSMLGTHDKDDMSRTLLAMSSSQDSCISMRQSGCLPLLIQLLHGNDKDSVLLGNSRGSKEARARASAALHNIIHSQPDDKRGRREIRVLHLLEQIRAYCETCWEWQEAHEQGMDQDKNPSRCSVWCASVCMFQSKYKSWRNCNSLWRVLTLWGKSVRSGN